MVLLSFDIEEFDFPTERGAQIDFQTQIDVSAKGLDSVLDMLDRHNVKATFYSTAIFAHNNEAAIHRIVASGHEIASHGWCHDGYHNGDYARSKSELERIAGVPVIGHRAARMATPDTSILASRGYLYDSSLNPTYIPGRYNNLHKPRSLHFDGSLWALPSSVTPSMRFPLFWLAFHTLPLWIYARFAFAAIRKDGYLNTYFHPWEFSNDLQNRAYRVPYYIHRCSGDALLHKLERFIMLCKARGLAFSTAGAYIKSNKK